MDIQQKILDMRFSDRAGLASIASELDLRLTQRGRGGSAITEGEIFDHFSDHIDITFAIQTRLMSGKNRVLPGPTTLREVGSAAQQLDTSIGPFVRASMAERVDFFERLRKQLSGQEEVLNGYLARLRGLGAARRSVGGDVQNLIQRYAEYLNGDGVPAPPREGEEDIAGAAASEIFPQLNNQSKLLAREVKAYQTMLKEYRSTVKDLLTIENPKRVLREIMERIITKMIFRISEDYVWEMRVLKQRLASGWDRFDELPEEQRGEQIVGLIQEITLEFSRKIRAEFDRTKRQVEQVLEETDLQWIDAL